MWLRARKQECERQDGITEQPKMPQFTPFFIFFTIDSFFDIVSFSSHKHPHNAYVDHEGEDEGWIVFRGRATRGTRGRYSIGGVNERGQTRRYKDTLMHNSI